MATGECELTKAYIIEWSGQDLKLMSCSSKWKVDIEAFHALYSALLAPEHTPQQGSKDANRSAALYRILTTVNSYTA